METRVGSSNSGRGDRDGLLGSVSTRWTSLSVPILERVPTKYSSLS